MPRNGNREDVGDGGISKGYEDILVVTHIFFSLLLCIHWWICDQNLPNYVIVFISISINY